MAFLFVQKIYGFLIRTVDVGLSYLYRGYMPFLLVQRIHASLIRTVDFDFLIRTKDTRLSYS